MHTCFVGKELEQCTYLFLRVWEWRKWWVDTMKYHAGGIHRNVDGSIRLFESYKGLKLTHKKRETEMYPPFK